MMRNLGFIVFRTPPEAPAPDSCLMAMIRTAPTLRHFDPEAMSFWITSEGRGRIETIDRSLKTPYRRALSWGRIRIADRLGARNSFVTFGGVVTGEPISRDALLVVCRSPAPILRLPGHSQREDRLAEEVLAFFGRVTPMLWRPEVQRTTSEASPLALFAAFLTHTTARLGRSVELRDALASDAPVVHHELARLTSQRPGEVAGGRELLEALGLTSRA
jgi:hypothetical protein